MKRLIYVSLFICLFLCGCKSSYSEPEQTVLISAIGIDKTDNDTFITLEIIDTQSGGLEYSTKTFQQQAKNVELAFSELQKSVGNKLFAEHCVIVIKGESLSDFEFLNCLVYLCEAQNVSQNTKIAETENANVLLKTKSRTGQAVGFDMVKILNLQNCGECDVYQVLRGLYEKNPPTIPLFTVTNDSYFLEVRNSAE